MYLTDDPTLHRLLSRHTLPPTRVEPLALSVEHRPLLKAPFPYYGGKSKIAAEIWRRLGDVPNYVEPFFGSGAILLARPLDHLKKARTETVNDKDGYIANFWRAIADDPVAVARFADWPQNENDLHARHAWLVAQHDQLVPRLEGDPTYYDAKIAGWWVWGMCLWIGSGFCSGNGPWRVEDSELIDVRHPPHLGNEGQGINRQLPHLGDEGRGVNRKRPNLANEGRGTVSPTRRDDLYTWFAALQSRLARVRVCSGDWSRVMGTP
jgi:DNA adenine methylase